MQTVDESTMDDVITTIDFATLFSQEELKAKRAEEKDRRKKNRILSVENSHFLIYLICLLISIVLIAAYLFLPCAETSKACCPDVPWREWVWRSSFGFLYRPL